MKREKCGGSRKPEPHGLKTAAAVQQFMAPDALSSSVLQETKGHALM